MKEKYFVPGGWVILHQLPRGGEMKVRQGLGSSTAARRQEGSSTTLTLLAPW